MERASRHKSCLACIQTKRKCDRTQPRCQRCMVRGSDCQYIGRKRVQQQEMIEHSTPNQPASTIFEWQLQQSLEAEPTNPALLLSLSCNQEIFEFPHHPFNLPLDGQSIDSTSSSHLTQKHPYTAGSDTKLFARVDYCATRLSLLPNVFASSGQNMFIHRQTFQTLRSPTLQQGMSACALYCMKTSATKTLVHQVLQHNVQQLFATTDPAESSSSDLLAALQALLLYQLIRLFDGDIRLRAAAEADEATTILWASELRTRVCTATLALNSAATFTDNPEDWQTWLFSESVRRTVVTAFLLRGVYNYLKTGIDSPTVVGVYFTAQEGLWNAQSEVGWTRARDEKLELQVLVNAWDETMALASPGDLEELGVLVMSMLWGLRATQNWLGYECSVKYGLDGQTWTQNALGPW